MISIKAAIRPFILSPIYQMSTHGKLWLENRRLLNAIDNKHSTTGGVQPWDYRVYSQNGEDGIVRRISKELGLDGRPFVEFGFSPYESNLLFFAAGTRARGLFIDGNNDACLRAPAQFERLGIKAKVLHSWIDRDNIDLLITSNIGCSVEILSIDMDGNDYWVWQAIQSIHPSLVIVEYNASFGKTRKVTTPYSPDFDRFKHHRSGVCHGMSLAAAVSLGNQKGYSLVCTDVAGLNAFFVRNDRLTPIITAKTVEEAFRPNIYRTNDSSPLELQEAIAFQGDVVDA